MLKGTLGAFIRGGLDTATQAIQQTAQIDEDRIVNDLKGFGAKKTKFDAGVAAYQTELGTIQDVASALSAQEDDFVKNLNPEELEDVAQSLITVSGAKNAGDAIKFFMENRDKLSTVTMPSAPAVNQNVATQTEAAIPTAKSPDDDKRPFLQKLFKGKTSRQIEQAVADRAGVSLEEYDRVMAGKIPTIASPDTRLRIGQEDVYEELVKEKQNSIVQLISKPAFLTMQEINLPNGQTMTGKQFADEMLSAYENYMVTGKNGENVAKMQNFALTISMPPDLKDFFQQHHGKSIDAIASGISNANIPEASRARLQVISSQLSNHMFEAATTPGYASNSKNVQAVGDLVIEGRKLLGTEVKQGTGKPTRQALLEESINELLQLATSTSPNAKQLKPEFSDQVYGLRNDLAAALESDDPVKAMDELAMEVQALMSNAFMAPTKAPSKDDTEVSTMMRTLRGINPRYQNMSDAELQKIAQQVLQMNPNGITRGKDGKNYLTVPDANGRVRSLVIGTDVGGTIVTDLSQEQISESQESLRENAKSLNRLAQLTSGLDQNPAVFTVLGSFNVAFGNFADVVGTMTGTDLGRLYDQTFGSSVDSETRREAIALIGKAKDELFDDPRLSDQDLGLVLKYVAILDTELSGIGTGKQNALAALQGLQTALMKDTAMRQYMLAGGKAQILPTTSLGPNKPDGWNGLHWYDENGTYKIDNSIAGRLMNQIHTAYNFTPKSKSEIEALANSTDQADREALALYAAKEDLFNSIVENAVHDLAVYEAGNVPIDNRTSNLLNMGTVNVVDNGDGTSRNEMTVNGVTYRVQSLKQAKAMAGS